MWEKQGETVGNADRKIAVHEAIIIAYIGQVFPNIVCVSVCVYVCIDVVKITS